MADMNQCCFSGNLGRDPELNFTPTGKAVAKVSLANGVWNGTSTDTQWITVVCWGSLAEYIANYGKKGMKVTVAGRLFNRSYTDKQGVKRTSLELTANSVVLPYSTHGDTVESEHTDPLGDLDEHPF